MIYSMFVYEPMVDESEENIPDENSDNKEANLNSTGFSPQQNLASSRRV
jgi:hypothetical protein